MSSPTRRDLLAGAAALGLGACGRGGDAGRTRGSRPNVLFLIADQHRADHAGYAGHEAAFTPHLDRLAREGAVLERLYCHDPLCVPARQSLITGRLAHEHGWYGNVGKFPEDLATLARHWRAHGYETAMIGKAHMATHDFEHVVEKAKMYRDWKGTHPGAGHAGDWVSEAPTTPERAHLSSVVRSLNPFLDAPREDEFQLEPTVVAETRRFLEGRDAARPFFLWASFVQPHPPRFPAEEWLDRFRGREVSHWGPPSAEDLAGLPGYAREMRAWLGFDALDAARLADLARAYHASLSWTDHWIGETVKLIEDAGLLGETLVVYTSDHGEMLGDHGLFGKSTLYEPACRVPAIVRFPDGARAGERVPRLAQHLDLVASLFALAGLPQPAGLAGAPLHELCGELASSPPAEEALCELYYRQPSHVEVPREDLASGLRVENWKYAFNAPGEESLFDLDADPEERRDLARDPGHRTRVDDLRARVRELVPETVYVMRRRG